MPDVVSKTDEDVEKAINYWNKQSSDASEGCLVNAAYGLARLEAERAYEDRSHEEDAVDILENFAAPLFNSYHGFSDEEPDMSFVEKFNDEETQEVKYALRRFGVKPDSDTFPEFKDNIAERFAENEFDYVFWIDHSGSPFGLSAHSYLDAESVPIKFSQYTSDDTEVEIYDLIEDNYGFKNTKGLVVDDAAYTEDSMYAVLEYLEELGVDAVGVTNVLCTDDGVKMDGLFEFKQ